MKNIAKENDMNRMNKAAKKPRKNSVYKNKKENKNKERSFKAKNKGGDQLRKEEVKTAVEGLVVKPLMTF